MNIEVAQSAHGRRHDGRATTDGSNPDQELSDILDRVAYEVTAARAAGLTRGGDLTRALKTARELIADAEALAGSEMARARDEGEQ